MNDPRQLELPIAEFMSVSEAARVLDVSPAMVKYLERTGRLACIRLGGQGNRYFHAADVQALHTSRQVELLLTGSKRRGPKRHVPPNRTLFRKVAS
jgi:hypothetical protein